MNKQLMNNGQVLMEQHNLVHLRNIQGNQMIFEIVDIDNGYVVLEPVDFKRFEFDHNRMNAFITGKPILKGVIGSQLKK